MPESKSLDGFVLTKQTRELGGELVVELWLLSHAGPVRVRSTVQNEVFFIRASSLEQASVYLQEQQVPFVSRELALKTFAQEPVAALYFSRLADAFQAKDILFDQHIECFESDIKLTDRYLMERFIYGGVLCEGQLSPRRGRFIALEQGKCQASVYEPPPFRTLSIDIECSEQGELYSIGLAAADYQCVLMIGAEQADTPEWLQWQADERALLHSFVNQIHHYDPDIIVGWNVINFDFRLLVKRAELQRVKLALGRDRSLIHWRDRGGEGEQAFISMPGRVVIDGIDALRSATYHFDSFSLDFVARRLLGKGKLSDDIDNRMAEITHNFRHDKLALARYNLEDCCLVLEILEHTDLLQYLRLRSQLTGLELQRMGGSVAAFINVYLPKLHRAGYISPNRPEDGGLASPGGYVMDSKPGLYKHVLVLDFKSLYPSIIRTFLIDPMGLIEGLAHPDDAVPGFKGALFSREQHFLPDIIRQLWQARDIAKQQKDAARSQAIKILMNSFYGVLGSGGCPFYDARLASSITMRGQEIMQLTAKWIEQEGYQVIYGDTDSTFVWLDGDYDVQSAAAVGLILQEKINQRWQHEIRTKYGLDCALDIEFETYFSPFLMPTIRGSSEGSKKRYAGFKQTEQGRELIFKGLETVRSDWTGLAKEFQLQLYTLVFDGLDVVLYIEKFIAETLSGKHDAKLVYRKRLRRRLDHYQLSSPPHVKAARHADECHRNAGRSPRYQHKGWISYVQTLNGPQALECQSSAIDYQHYIDKQIRPVAEAILPFVGLSFDEIVDTQLGLF